MQHAKFVYSERPQPWTSGMPLCSSKAQATEGSRGGIAGGERFEALPPRKGQQLAGEGGALLGGSQRGVDDCRHARGIQVDVGAGFSGEPRFTGTVQFDQALHDILVGGVDDGVGADLQRLVQAGRDDIDDHDVAYAKGLEGQRRAEPNRTSAEDGDLVRRFGFALVGAVAGAIEEPSDEARTSPPWLP